MRLSTILFSAAVLLTGCGPTEYKQLGGVWGGALGYQDFRVRDDLYFVSYTSNNEDGIAHAHRYFHRRAAEVCKEAGFSGYEPATLESGSTNRGSASSFTVPMAGGGFAGIGLSSSLPTASGYIRCLRA